MLIYNSVQQYKGTLSMVYTYYFVFQPVLNDQGWLNLYKCRVVIVRDIAHNREITLQQETIQHKDITDACY